MVRLLQWRASDVCATIRDALLDPKAAPTGLGSLLDPKAAPTGLGSLLDPQAAPTKNRVGIKSSNLAQTLRNSENGIKATHQGDTESNRKNRSPTNCTRNANLKT
jgi:hypothetical protein